MLLVEQLYGKHPDEAHQKEDVGKYDVLLSIESLN